MPKDIKKNIEMIWKQKESNQFVNENNVVEDNITANCNHSLTQQREQQQITIKA